MQTTRGRSAARDRRRERRTGSSLVIVSVLVSSVMILALSLLALITSGSREQRGYREDVSALVLCEAGIGNAVFDLQSGGTGDLGGTNAPVQFGNGSYWVQSEDLGGGMVSLSAVGADNRSRARVELVVDTTPSSDGAWAAFGDEALTMDSNAFIDSYDSGEGSYESQDVNWSGSDFWANDEGNVGSNASIAMSQNSIVHGDAWPGPGGSLTLTGNATVTGSTVAATAAVEMPPLDRPSFGSAGPLTVGGSDTHSLEAGEHEFDALVLSNGSTLRVQGPATLVASSLELQSGSEIVVDASAGPVLIYVVNDFVMNSNTLITSTTQTPADLKLHLESDNVIDPDLEVDLDLVDFDSNARLYGSVYAPKASIEINSNFELFGSIVARRLHLDSNSQIHFDEALLASSESAEGGYRVVCWRLVGLDAH